MSSSKTSTSPTPAPKKPRRHPTSRGMRKHVREEKRLGLVENQERRRARIRKSAGVGGPKRVQVSDFPHSRGNENLCPHPGCGHLKTGRYVTVFDISSNQHVQIRRCPKCKEHYRDFEIVFGHLKTAEDIGQACPHCQTQHQGYKGQEHMTVDAGRQQVIICTNQTCGMSFKPFRLIVLADLDSATSDWNDCPYRGCSWTSSSKTGHISGVQTDSGFQQLATCGKCKRHYKPFVAQVRGKGSGYGSWLL